MDTQELSGRLFRYIVLIPHKDALKRLDEYRQTLFSAGFYGAFSFPAAAPLAAVSRPFTLAELKELSSNIRGRTKEKKGKIRCGAIIRINYGEKLACFGPVLDLHMGEELIPGTAASKIINIFSQPVFCAALTPDEEKPFPKESPALSFRAASLANLALRPLDSGAPGYSFEWHTGPRIWLPKYKEDKKA